ncbi:hypothetical protein SAMD00019534_055070 [Acytostelium subglobosum LB1]|uniref:hypothetical protein n=1 Tax=Acytostelium subglobosum LB1 TaxID=1410327 RepID=UPI000644C5B2|nr:hypothetical protein SAMD00019534_055070 [Acytostelium subglobosum LB1]GAM22332.1 hypothetical protein SAMD00019534_055070 [Acytostelium subglobosum LB1]|eukprot:XP_012754452.1 hypothetical protein SAMD00019534_055070 [Acytostelium subglobosum LB1]
MTNNESKDRCEQLPHLSSLHLPNNVDFLDEIILEPLSSTTATQQQLLSPLKSPVRSSQGGSVTQTSSSPSSSYDRDRDQYQQDEYYCTDCKKRFQSEQTWNTHVSSAKHIQQAKENKKKTATTTGGGGSRSSPNPKTPPHKQQNTTTTTPTKTTSKTSGTGDDPFSKKQHELMTIIPSKPNLTVKNLFQAAKNYTAHHMIRDAAECLSRMLTVLSSSNTSVATNNTSTTLTLDKLPLDLRVDVLAKLSLEAKTHLNFGRLTRLFDQRLSEYHFIKCLIKSNLLLTGDTHHQRLSMLCDAEYLGRVMAAPLAVMERLTNAVHSSIISLESDGDILNDDMSESSSTTTSSSSSTNMIIVETMVTFIDEIAGALSFNRVNNLSMLLYSLSYVISSEYQLHQRSITALQRLTRLLFAQGRDHVVADMYTMQFKLVDSLGFNEGAQLAMIHSLKYALGCYDLVRVSSILGTWMNSGAKSRSTSSTSTSCWPSLTLLIGISESVINNDTLQFDQLFDRYEHVLSHDRDIHNVITSVQQQTGLPDTDVNISFLLDFFEYLDYLDDFNNLNNNNN